MDEFNQQHHDREHEPVMEQRPPEKNPPVRIKRRGGFFPALFGALVGGLIVYFSMGNVGDGGEVSKNDQGHVQTVQKEKRSIEIDSELTKVVGEVTDAVVGVTNVQTVRDFWSMSERTQETGTGSGVIYKKEGDRAYIVTNYHVVEGAQQLEITFDDGTKTSGTLVGSDMWTDLAVIEIDSKNVNTVVEFGDSDALQRGETVIAIGNPLGLGFSGSVTVGVVSGKDRSIPIDFDENGTIDWQADVLQTDAAINPGNSGGALINMAGQLVGINSMKISQAAVEGIGLAIPINLAEPIIHNLETTGTVNRPTMGVTLMDLRGVPEQQQREVLKLPEEVKDGVVVTDVIRNSPAQAAGVQKYDVIVEMDGDPITDMVSLRKHLYNKKAVGDTMAMKVYRNGQQLTIEMELKDGNSF